MMIPEQIQVVALCPTYRRPLCLLRSIYLFLKQTHPNKRLIIWDDGPDGDRVEPVDYQFADAPDTSITIINSLRFSSLPEKFNAIAGLANHKAALAVWEDDDVYLPWHLANIAELASQHVGAHWLAKPKDVLSNYPGHIVMEKAEGRFHASLAFSRELFNSINGWPITRAANFDQQFISALLGHGDLYDDLPISYLFRWHGAGTYHGQSTMKNGSDETWYDYVPIRDFTADEYRAMYSLNSMRHDRLQLDWKVLANVWADSFEAEGLIDELTRRAGTAKHLGDLIG